MPAGMRSNSLSSREVYSILVVHFMRTTVLPHGYLLIVCLLGSVEMWKGKRKGQSVNQKIVAFMTSSFIDA
jgi:uncharacterized membrane protein YagU involved in acid resistance